MKVLKWIGILVVAVLFFAGSLAGLLAFNGNLSKEGLEKLRHPKTAEQKAEAGAASDAPEDESSALAQALKQRAEELDKREAKLREEEERIKKARTDLESLRAEVQSVQTQISASVKTVDSDRQKRMADVALSLSKMKASNAAETLKTWPVQDAVGVLRLVKDKERAKILDAMPPEQSAALLMELQNKKL